MLPFKCESHMNSEIMQLPYIGSEANYQEESNTFYLHSLYLGCSKGGGPGGDRYLLHSKKGKNDYQKEMRYTIHFG